LKIFHNKSTWEAALDRIRWLFDEFPNVIVNFSGGKDSTVCLHLALKVAEEKGRLPLKVAWIDQEAEWQATSDYVKSVMENPQVDPLWYQMPLKLFNSTSPDEEWLHCWEEGKEKDWIRPRWKKSITKNIYGTQTFKDLFDAIQLHDYKGEKCVRIAGVRCEESPARYAGMTTLATYKDATWGRKNHKTEEHYTMYPLYDWSYTDIWKAIHDNNWEYNKVYDYMYQYGVGVLNMRVSNVHHETAVGHLFYLQEIEPETWEKLVHRVKGINTAGVLKSDGFKITKLPYMFKSWKEYRDYLLVNLIDKEDIIKKFQTKFEQMENKYIGSVPSKTEISMYKVQINAILHNDHYFTKLNNFGLGGDFISIDAMKKKERANAR